MPRSLFRLSWILLVGLILSPRALDAQFPGEIAGRVTDAATGTAVQAASVELPAIGRTALTDGTGAFRLRGLEPGAYRMLVRRAGYASAEMPVDVRNGETARINASLRPASVALAEVRVRADAVPAGGTRFAREEIEQSGARTAGDVVGRAPGVVLRQTGAGAAQTASIRGSASDAVLVLVDGVALNDPVTGEADLSSVPAHDVQSVTVLPGAQAARYGPRAQAGVVLIETRAPDRRRSLAMTGGSLGEAAGRGEWGGGAHGVLWSAGASARRLDGAFTHPKDPHDPTLTRRANADLREAGAFAAAQATVAGGELRVRGAAEGLERGIPGLGYAPSIRARETMRRGRGSLAWRRGGESGSAALDLSGVSQAVRFRDPAPPFGLAYDTRTRVRSLHGRAEAERLAPVHGVRAWGAGVESTVQRVDGGGLSDAAPRTRTDAGGFAHASTGTAVAGVDLAFTAAARADRDPVARRWYASRALSAEASTGGISIRLANRSSFSPPSLGDQFFREGVAVAPNPDLRAERVPNEWELGVSADRRVGGASLSAGASAYRSDVRGMIVWLPDYRFVWSPRNTDVKRRGVDAWAEASLPRDVTVRASYSLAAATYDRAGDADTVQVAYRPRHSGRVRGAWAPGPWRAELGAEYVGRRNPDPSPANALPGFWTLDAGAARAWRAGRWTLDTALRIDRLRGERDALIAGYPEPGRRLTLDLRLHGAERP
ncbi:MAG: Iron complex outerrane recepter protein [Gemmatimonadetes bacterium]|nr:Iron complex outerrane recepter protein [Gemmatimonadota bacterium]